MVYKINVPLVGGGTRKKEIIDADNNLTVDEIRARTVSTFFKFQGSTSGYSSGGNLPSRTNVIEKFPFASDANAADVGDLTEARGNSAGQSSSTNGYTSGGNNGPSDVNTIDKFPFSSDTNATDVGDLTQARLRAASQSSQTNGYTSGGLDPPLPSSSEDVDTIDKFPFSSDANATDVGDLTQGRSYLHSGQSSDFNGYTSGGYDGTFGDIFNTIDKFPFATDANATDVGDLTQARRSAVGQSSSTHGYTSGGASGPPTNHQNTIDKFPFSINVNVTDVGNLTDARINSSGQSSTASGYTSGGWSPPRVNIIDKFPFSSDANATDVGDLTQSKNSPTGQQV